jgi:hypothetical protein
MSIGPLTAYVGHHERLAFFLELVADFQLGDHCVQVGRVTDEERRDGILRHTL